MYDVKAKGFPGGVEVGIYFHGQAKTGTPLKVLEYNTDYADNIMKIINMCPQMYLTQAVVEAINKDVIVRVGILMNSILTLAIFFRRWIKRP